MFNKLFSRNDKNEVVVAEKNQTISSKSNKEIIEEIHETFYTEVDRLLDEAGITKQCDPVNQALIDKAERLKKIGFSATKEVSEAGKDLEKIRETNQVNKEKEKLKECIHYFSQKYPLYKFITQDSVKKICKKYGLVFGSSEKYIGTMPTKNLEDIERFKIDEHDMCYQKVKTYFLGWNSRSREEVMYMNKSSFDAIIKSDEFRLMAMDVHVSYDKCPLEIAAPAKDFDLSRAEIVDYEIKEIPDPVVLQPVYYKGEKHYLIVTAWGEEASDELVVNQRMN